MSENIAIKINGLKKKYRLGQIGGGTLTADLQLGGFWQITGLPMSLTSTAAGVSERYWK